MPIIKITCAFILVSSLTPAMAANLPTKPTKPAVYVTIGVQNGHSVVISNGKILNGTISFENLQNYINAGNSASLQAPMNLPCTFSALCFNNSN